MSRYKIKLLISDSDRHMRASGYGALSRAIILALKRYSNFEIVIEKRRSDWEQGIAHQEELLKVTEIVKYSEVDAVLRIGTPKGKNQYGIPTIVYTQNALADLPPAWIESLSEADGIIVPGEFDARVFRRYFQNVFLCPQFADPTVFKPIPTYRQEGVKALSFLFVGSYSYRKGVDLICPIFANAFADGQPVHLRLHCFSGLEKEGFSHLLQQTRKLPKNIEISVFSGSVSPNWMTRYYNRHDVIFSFSRGEGWCMPLHESLLCGKPILAPNSTAMGEMLPVDGVRRIMVKEQIIEKINDPFGLGMRKQYGHPGNICWEVEPEDAVVALREIAENYGQYASGAIKGREAIMASYTLKRIAQEISATVTNILNKNIENNSSTTSIKPVVIHTEHFDTLASASQSVAEFTLQRTELIKQRRFEEVHALELLELAKRPSDADLLRKMAWTLVALKRVKEAEDFMKQALAIAPQNVEYQRILREMQTPVIESMVFKRIYDENRWQSAESASGSGSTIKATHELIPQLLNLIERLNVHSFLDIPCGDFNWIRPVVTAVSQYVGGDIVPEVVEIARQRATDLLTPKFEIINLVSERLPKADMLMSRDCLVHLDFDLALSAIKNIYSSDINWLLITTFPDVVENKNVKTGCWRPLNMELPPFSLPKPDQLIIERPSIPAHERWGRKALGLWKIIN